MKKSQLFNLLEYSLENILAGGWGVKDLPPVITDLLNTLNSKDQVSNVTELETILDDLLEGSITPSDLPTTCIESLNAFIEDYEPFPNMVKVDCKVDMAIPKEDLEKNLQLLIDRQGLQWLNTVIDSLANQKAMIGRIDNLNKPLK